MTAAIDVKQAVESATAYFAQLMNASDVRLEEVEISDDERLWRVTLSGLIPVPQATRPTPFQTQLSGLAELFGGNFERVYKVFTVDAATGSVKSMKIRTIE